MQSEVFKDDVLSKISHLSGINCNRMFRHWGLYYCGHFIGIIAENRFFLRTNALTRHHYTNAGMRPYNETDQDLQKFYQVPREILANAHELASWVAEATSIKYTTPSVNTTL